MSTEHDKIAAAKADAFELGMHQLLKEAGVKTQAEAEHFFKIAAALAQYETKEAALKALKGLGEKAVDVAKANPKATAVGAGAAVGGAGFVAGRKSKEDKKKPLFGKKK